MESLIEKQNNFLSITSAGQSRRFIATTNVPIDFNEWYFICATYNPFIQEDESFSDESIYDQFKNNREFWMNHINPIGGAPIVNSTYGNKCKVEIISRSDLLRARGFKG